MPPPKAFALRTCRAEQKEPPAACAIRAESLRRSCLAPAQKRAAGHRKASCCAIDRLGALACPCRLPAGHKRISGSDGSPASGAGLGIGWVISAYLQEKNAAAAFALLQRYPQYASDPQDEEHALFYTWLDTEVSVRPLSVCRAPHPQRSLDPLRFRFPTPQPNDRWLADYQSLRF